MAKKGKGNQIGIYIIVGLICVAMLGFGATQFGGSINSIGAVGDREISAQRYYTELTQRINQLSQQAGQRVTLAQAQAFGLDQAALQTLIASVSLEAEADELGLSAGDTRVRDEILRIPGFQALDGSFDRTAYAEGLRRNGLNERTFEDNLRAEISRTILQGAVVSGVETPALYSETLINFVGERRSFTWGSVTADMLAEPIPAPTDEDLQSYFSANEAAFMLPETRQITYAWMTPDMLLDQVEASDEDLRAAYEARNSEFNTPERRLVERLNLGSAAADAKARLDAGEITFEDLVAERELSLEDIDLGDVALEDLGDAGAAVFAADLGVVGPIETDLGAALFRVNAILAAQETSFEDARETLAADLAREAAANLIVNEIDAIDDLLAGGATLEDLASETDMELGQIDWNSDSAGAIADFAAFRRAAATAQQGDFPELVVLENDGGIFALRVNEVIAPRLAEFEDVKAQAEEGWRAEATITALSALAETLTQDWASDTAPDGVTLTEETALQRDAFVDGASAELMIEVFEMETGGVAQVPGDDAVQVVLLGDILPPDPEDETLNRQREALETSTARGIGSDILAAYANSVQNTLGVTLDQSAIQAVHVNIP